MNYNLKNLDEVESYIKENKHLPDVPSAENVGSEGISLGDMSKLQMQKIEELTLYAIKLEKTNQNLESRLEKLEALVLKK